MARVANPNQARIRKLRNKLSAARSRAVKKAMDIQRDAMLDELLRANATLQKKVDELCKTNERLRHHVQTLFDY